MTSDRTITAPLATAAASEPPVASTPLAPRTGAAIGRYVVLGQLGSGAMGVVLSAWDPELARRVALKRLRLDFGRGGDRSARRERLAGEARAMARLAHPNVVHVFDVLVADDELYVAMELVEGDDLRTWVRTKHPEPRTIVEVMIAAGRGLAAAHERGIVHGDFKPDNVLLDATGRARVADFGLARATVHRAGTAVDAPSAQVVGTPAYMAPELLRGRPADAKSDQFAFCTTAFELLYGERPFAGRDMDERLSAMLDGPITTTERAVPRRWRKILVRGLAAHPDARWSSMVALLAELERNPARERRLLVQVGAAVLVCTGAAAVVSRRDPCAEGPERIAEVWNEQRRATITAAFAGSELVSAEGAARRAIGALDEYAEAWVAAHRDACEATRVRGEQSAARLEARMICLDRRRADVDAIADALGTVDAATILGVEDVLADLRPVTACDDVSTGTLALSDADAERARAAERAIADARALVPTRRFDAAEAAIASATAELQGIQHPALFAEIDVLRGRILRERARYDEARDVQTSARLAAEAAGVDDVKLDSELELVHLALETNVKPTETRAAFDDAEATWMRLGRPAALEHQILRYEAAVLGEEDRIDEAIAALERAHALALVHAPERAPSILGKLGNVRANLGQYDAAIAQCREALEQATEQLGAAHPTVADLRYKLAGVHTVQGSWPEAEAELRTALAETRASWGSTHPRVAEILSRLAGAHAHRAEYEQALALHTEAFAIAVPALGPDHPNVADLYTARGAQLREMGRSEEALADLERALAIYRATFGERSLLTAKARANHAMALMSMGRADEAEPELVESIAVQERVLGPEHPHLAGAIEPLATLRGRQGRLDEAEPLLLRVLRIRERELGEDHLLVAITRQNLGMIELKRGHWDLAATWCERALAIRRAQLGDAHPELASSLVCLGDAALHLGDAQAAATRYTDAIDVLRSAPDRQGSLADAEFGLAQALVRREPARARSLAESAHRRFVALPSTRPERIAEIEAWIAAHRR